jgi:hypothetical protein
MCNGLRNRLPMRPSDQAARSEALHADTFGSYPSEHVQAAARVTSVEATDLASGEFSDNGMTWVPIGTVENRLDERLDFLDYIAAGLGVT